MVSFDAIANAKWGQDVLVKDGTVKHNVPYSQVKSFVTCGTWAKHIMQKTEDVRLGSQAVKAALQAAKDQQEKAELYGNAAKKINELIELTNKPLAADKKIDDTFKITFPAQEEQVKAPEAEAVAPAATSVLEVQKRSEEVASPRAKRLSATERLKKETDRILANPRYWHNSTRA